MEAECEREAWMRKCIERSDSGDCLECRAHLAALAMLRDAKAELEVLANEPCKYCNTPSTYGRVGEIRAWGAIEAKWKRGEYGK